MVSLHVVLDPVLEGSPRGIARYAEELTRALIETAPADCDVVGVVSASPDIEYAALLQKLPGLAGLHKSALARRELYAAWQHGATSGQLPGMVHSPTLLAPLRSHDRARTPGRQTVVTIHDANPWLFPRSGDRRAGWARTMAKRAQKHADAVVVPSHAVAEDLSDFIDLGSRVRVIPGAPSPSLVLPDDADQVAASLGLPSEYLLTVGSLQPQKGMDALLAALALPTAPDLPLVVVGPDVYRGRTFATALHEAGLAPRRVLHLGHLTDAELAVVYSEATAFVLPSENEGFGLTVVEAFAFGVPTITSDAPALVEVADGASVLVPRQPREGYAERLAEALGTTLGSSEDLERLSVVGGDRSKAFTWRDSAERTWQLHADL
jgi:glycosyltransferase involved in cell wall biosynthesis